MKFWKNVLWSTLTTAIVFYLAFMVFGKNVVFGNTLMNPVQAVIVSSLIVGLAVSLVAKWGEKQKIQDNLWALIYWVVNTGVIYLIARTPVSEFVGIGLKPAVVSAVVLGLIVNFAQYGVWRAMNKGK